MAGNKKETRKKWVRSSPGVTALTLIPNWPKTLLDGLKNCSVSKSRRRLSTHIFAASQKCSSSPNSTCPAFVRNRTWTQRSSPDLAIRPQTCLLASFKLGLLVVGKEDPDPDGRVVKGVFPGLHLPVRNWICPGLVLLMLRGFSW